MLVGFGQCECARDEHQAMVDVLALGLRVASAQAHGDARRVGIVWAIRSAGVPKWPRGQSILDTCRIGAMPGSLARHAT